ncbi:hypothetical protein ACJJTC_008346 [Scirpophaga incertulas]
MHELFTRQYPEVKVSEQRIADQRRIIVRNKLLTQEIIEHLKEESRLKIQEDLENATFPPSQNTNTLPPITEDSSQYNSATRSHLNQSQTNLQTTNTFTQTESITLTLENDNEILDIPETNVITGQEILDKFKMTLIQYSGLEPAARPKLPKLNSYIRTNELQITEHTENRRNKLGNTPPWQHRLEKDIEKLRADCGRLTQYINDNRSNKLVKRVEAILKNTYIHTKHENNNKKLEEFLDTLKQKQALKVHRLKRYKKAQKRRNENGLFSTNEKLFYRNLNTTSSDILNDQTPPSKDELETFWARLWEEQAKHNDTAPWIIKEKEKWRQIDEMEFLEITESDITNTSQVGYGLKNGITETTISHLIYMDDIKLYAQSERDMKKLIDITTEFSTDINMRFGLDKCKILHIIRGKIRPGDYTLSNTDTISAMESTDLYKYLGYTQLKGLDHTKIKSTITAEYKRRINTICKTQLYAKNLFKAINTYAIPVLTYSFGVIKWTKTDIEQLERLTRTTLTKHNNLHPKSAIERLTIKRQNGGRGLIDIKHLWQKQINNLTSFFHVKSQTSKIHKAITLNDNNYTPLNLNDRIDREQYNENNLQKEKIENWKKKVLHGRHPHDLQHVHINNEASNIWLKIDKISKYAELKDEVTRIWRQNKVYVIPIVLSTTGVIPNHLFNSLKILNLKDTLFITIQKAAILNTCRIVRKFLQIDENNIDYSPTTLATHHIL